jgi:hypothetical protein
MSLCTFLHLCGESLMLQRPLRAQPRDLTLTQMIVHLVDGTDELFRHRLKSFASRGFVGLV